MDKMYYKSGRCAIQINDCFLMSWPTSGPFPVSPTRRPRLQVCLEAASFFQPERLGLTGLSPLLLLRLSKPYAWPAAVLVDELDPGGFQGASDCEVVSCGHGSLAIC